MAYQSEFNNYHILIIVFLSILAIIAIVFAILASKATDLDKIREKHDK